MLVIPRLKQLSILCFLIFAICTTTFSQTTKVEQLLGQLNDKNPDTVQIQIMRKLSTAYSAVDPVKKFYYANQYKLLAEKNGIDSLVASAYLDMGISYGIRSKLDSAIYYFNLGYQKAKKSNYEVGIARGLANLGYAYDRTDRKKEALKNYEAALKIYERLNIKKSINQMITNIGAVYFDLGIYKTADFYFRQVLENVKETPKDEIGLGNALSSLGNSNLKLGNLKTSLSYYQKSLLIREKIGDLNGIALSNWGLGKIYVEKKEYNKALGYLNIALKNNRILKNTYQECAALITVVDAYLGLKDYKKADEHAKLALEKAKETDSKIALSMSLEALAKVSSTKKEFEQALIYQKAYDAVSDSLKTEETRKEVINVDLNRINTNNKILTKDNKNIKSINSEYIIIISIITILLVLVVILLVLYYKRNLEKKQTNILLEKQKQEIAEVNEELGSLNEELTTQMDLISTQNTELEKLNLVKNKFFSIISHDLRSPLNSLKMLFELYRRGDLSEEELGGLLDRLENTIQNTAYFLDNLLEWSKSQLEGIVVNAISFKIQPIIEENITLMDSQIKLKGLKVSNEIAPEISAYADPNMITVVVRNLLSNAIKFCNKGDEVFFEATLKNDKVTFCIKDTGPGINSSQQENLFNLSHTTTVGTAGERGYHIGLIICRDMVLQNNGTITVASEMGKGTTFNITLPIHELS